MVWAEDFTMVWSWWEQEALLYCQMRPVKCPEWEWPGVPPSSLSASPEVGERTEVTAPRRVVTGLGLSWSKAAANTAMNSTRWCSCSSEMGLEEETTIISHWSKQIHHSQQLQTSTAILIMYRYYFLVLNSDQRIPPYSSSSVHWLESYQHWKKKE